MRSVTFNVTLIGMKSTQTPPPRKYRQTGRADATEETARQILDAFSDSMQRQWFDEVTLEEVADRAGVHVRTVIRRFGGKEGLLETFVDDFIPSVAIDRATPPGDVAAAIDRLMDIYETWGDSVIRNLAQEPRHPALKRLLDLGRERHRAITAATYAPWLDRLSAPDRLRTLDALVAATDVYVWKLARRDMGHSRADVAQILHTLVGAVLAHASSGASKGSPSS